MAKAETLLNLMDRIEYLCEESESTKAVNKRLLKLLRQEGTLLKIRDLVNRTGYTRAHIYHEMSNGNLVPTCLEANENESPLFDDIAIRKWLTFKNKPQDFIERVLL